MKIKKPRAIVILFIHKPVLSPFMSVLLGHGLIRSVNPLPHSKLIAIILSVTISIFRPS